MKSKEIIDKLEKYEQLFAKNDYNGEQVEGVNFVIRPGNIPVMVSAPHAVNTQRGGEKKVCEVMTGAISTYLQHECGCWAIQKIYNDGSDPNYDVDNNRYQEVLEKYIKENDIKYLIDIHGADEDRPFAVEIGTAPFSNNVLINPIALMVKKCFDIAFEDLDVDEKEVLFNKEFTADEQNTITRYISNNTDCQCIQLEINGKYRTNPQALARLVNVLVYIIGLLK